MSTTSQTAPSCAFLFDMARCRSHLFFRFLSTHPKVQPFWHPFLPAFLFGPERFTLQSKNAREGEWVPPPDDGGPTYHEVETTFREALEEAREKEMLFVANEHCQMVLQQRLTFNIIRNSQASLLTTSNPTVIPDPIFTSLVPIFIIRNPIFSVPSVYLSFSQGTNVQPGDEDWTTITDLRLQRLIFEQFKSRSGTAPLVIDGDDVVWRTEELRTALSKALNLDPEGFSEVWQAVPENQRSKWPVIRHFLSTIDTSEGIERTSETPPDSDLEVAVQQWVELYGEDIAGKLRKTVEENLPHYGYLKGFKI